MYSHEISSYSIVGWTSSNNNVKIYLPIPGNFISLGEETLTLFTTIHTCLFSDYAPDRILIIYF